MAWQNSAAMGANGGVSGGGGDGGNNGGQPQGTEYTLQGGEDAPAPPRSTGYGVQLRRLSLLAC